MNHTNCQFRDKHTVEGIVFYKHAFLVYFYFFAAAAAAHIEEPFWFLYFENSKPLAGCSIWKGWMVDDLLAKKTKLFFIAKIV